MFHESLGSDGEHESLQTKVYTGYTVCNVMQCTVIYIYIHMYINIIYIYIERAYSIAVSSTSGCQAAAGSAKVQEPLVSKPGLSNGEPLGRAQLMHQDINSLGDG